jgi:hypothetical protein
VPPTECRPPPRGAHGTAAPWAVYAARAA